MNPHHPQPNTDPSKLSAAERADMKRAFISYMEVHPPVAPLPSPYYPAMRRLQFAALSLVLMMLGGSTVAAEYSEPDDLLYPIKTNLIEAVMVSTSLTDTDRARTYSTLVERRLEEAEELASEDQLTVEYATLLTAKIEEHADEAHARIGAADAPEEMSDALEISTDLETAFEAHREILENLVQDVPAQAAEAEQLLDAVEVQSNDTEAVGDRLEDALADASPSEAQEYLAELTVESNSAINRLAALVEERSQDDTPYMDEIEALLAGARESYADGISYQNEGDTDSALAQFRAALQDAEQGRIMREAISTEGTLE